MYIIAIAWLYVVILMALTETSVVAGVATFLFYGLGPLLLFWYVVGTPARKRRQSMRVRMGERADQPDAEHAKPDQ